MGTARPELVWLFLGKKLNCHLKEKFKKEAKLYILTHDKHLIVEVENDFRKLDWILGKILP